MSPFLSLRTVGPLRPLARSVIDEAAKRHEIRFPTRWITRMCSDGPGWLCGFARLLDPTDTSAEAEVEYWRRWLLTEGRSLRGSGQWNLVEKTTWDRLFVFAVCQNGAILAWEKAPKGGIVDPHALGSKIGGSADELPIWYLDQLGRAALRVSTDLDGLVRDLLLGELLDRVDPPVRSACWALPDVFRTVGAEIDFPAQIERALASHDGTSVLRLASEWHEQVALFDVAMWLAPRVLECEVPLASRAELYTQTARWLHTVHPFMEFVDVLCARAEMSAVSQLDDGPTLSVTGVNAQTPTAVVAQVREATVLADRTIIRVRNDSSAPLSRWLLSVHVYGALTELLDASEHVVEAIAPGETAGICIVRRENAARFELRFAGLAPTWTEDDLDQD